MSDVLTVGLAVAMKEDRKATAYGVVVSDDSGTATIVDSFAVTNDESDLATRLFDMAQTVRTRVGTLGPACVVIRRADFPPTGSRAESPKVRLLAEGAITSASRAKCQATFLATGKEIGDWCGTDKAGLDADAKALVKSAGLAQKFAPAASAALGGLTR